MKLSITSKTDPITVSLFHFVGFDIVEFNPFYDNKGQQTARLVRRIMLQFLTGIAMKKDGVDPKYVHPRVSGDP